MTIKATFSREEISRPRSDIALEARLENCRRIRHHDERCEARRNQAE
jgi:hypothetical protein